MSNEDRLSPVDHFALFGNLVPASIPRCFLGYEPPVCSYFANYMFHLLFPWFFVGLVCRHLSLSPLFDLVPYLQPFLSIPHPSPSTEIAQYMSVTYQNSYKILRNTLRNETYVLYLCNTPRPAQSAIPNVRNGTTVKFVEIPLKNVGCSSRSAVTYLEVGFENGIGEGVKKGLWGQKGWDQGRLDAEDRIAPLSPTMNKGVWHWTRLDSPRRGTDTCSAEIFLFNCVVVFLAC